MFLKKKFYNLLDLTNVTHLLTPGKGNIHTGAIPPWLLDDSGKPKNIINSYQPLKFLKKSKKSKKPEKLGFFYLIKIFF